ncbi:D-tyrosyl-tRNA(Tyr) deacylase [Chitinibacter bivalviorum]|uniref:D-aminoacyl-tRNA deacylase n=1 Tax=Chitinibacter bivalviorum TaxID=2739434 RepID=A0A7H9BER2_9NEIS|nr:D-aminoacyl-tRNA deacylase [Chitinibacter bivalviorum]QLG87047.1 D-tyrosyl-tRNA(Tyr) deacylase [Chitinibacter bivalviorum]
MRVLVQRVSHANVVVAEQIVGQIGAGLLLLVGVTHEDSEADIQWLVNKIANLRIFSDANDVMNLSLLDTQGQALAVSQFTLYASNKKGNRPSWSAAAPGAVSEPMFNAFVAALSQKIGQAVPTGQFGADMKVTLTNDGPVTIWLDSKNPE